jgi:hypothetical protein
MAMYVCYRTVSSHRCSHVLTQMADLCSKLCYLRDKAVTLFLVSKDKGGEEIKI